MITIKKGGIVHQMMYPFGFLSDYSSPKTICGVFWQATLAPLLFLLVGALAAVILGYVLAGFAALLVTGVVNTSVSVSLLVSGTLGFAALFVYCCENLDKVETKLSSTEVVRVAKEAYKNHKEKHCTLVQYEE